MCSGKMLRMPHHSQERGIQERTDKKDTGEPALEKYLPEIEPHGFLHSPVIGTINIVNFSRESQRTVNKLTRWLNPTPRAPFLGPEDQSSKRAILISSVEICPDFLRRP